MLDVQDKAVKLSIIANIMTIFDERISGTGCTSSDLSELGSDRSG